MLKISKYVITGLTLLMSFSALSQTTPNSDTYVVSKIQNGGATELIFIRPQAGTPVANPADCARTDWYVLEDNASDFQRAMLLAAIHTQSEVRLFVTAVRCTESAAVDVNAGFPVVTAIRYP